MPAISARRLLQRPTAALAAVCVVVAAVAASAPAGSRPEAVDYGSREPGPAESVIAPELLDARWPGLELDPALSRAALAYARTAGTSPPTPQNAIRLEDLMLQAGCPDPGARAVVVATSEDDPTDLLEALAPLLTARPTPDRVGIARLPVVGARYRWQWVAVAVARRMELAAPVPHRIAPGQRVAIELTLAPGLGAPRLVVRWPDGHTDRRPLQSRDGSLWTATLPPAEDDGTLEIQVLADGDLGAEVVGNLHLEVGVAETRAEHPQPTPDPQLPPPARLRWMVNRFRVAHGRPALAPDPELDRVALDHCEELALRGVLSHRSASGAELDERLAAAGYRFRVALENLARAGDLGAAHQSLTRSPSHRANLLSPEVSSLGVGIVDRVADDGVHEVYVTEVLAAPVRVPLTRDVLAAARAALLRSTGLAATDPRLDRAASRLAERPDLPATPASDILAEVRAGLGSEGQRPARLACEVGIAAGDGAVEAPRSRGILGAAAVGVGVAVIEAPGDPPRVQVLYLGTGG